MSTKGSILRIINHTKTSFLNYFGFPLGLEVGQGWKYESVVEKIWSMISFWRTNIILAPGRLVIINHIIGGMLNFFLNIWFISKSVVQGVNMMLRRFLLNKDRNKVIEIGWKWCIQGKENKGLGVVNIL